MSVRLLACCLGMVCGALLLASTAVSGQQGGVIVIGIARPEPMSQGAPAALADILSDSLVSEMSKKLKPPRYRVEPEEAIATDAPISSQSSLPTVRTYRITVRYDRENGHYDIISDLYRVEGNQRLVRTHRICPDAYECDLEQIAGLHAGEIIKAQARPKLFLKLNYDAHPQTGKEADAELLLTRRIKSYLKAQPGGGWEIKDDACYADFVLNVDVKASYDVLHIKATLKDADHGLKPAQSPYDPDNGIGLSDFADSDNKGKAGQWLAGLVKWLKASQ